MATTKQTNKKSGGIVVQELIIKAPNRRPWDVNDWRMAMRSADRGRMAPLYDLYEDMLVDTTLADAIDKRIGAVVNADITFFDAQGKEVEAIKEIIDTEEFENLQNLIMQGRLKGRAGAEFGWSDSGLIVSEIPPKHIDVEHHEILLDPTDERGISYVNDPYLMILGKSRYYGIILRAIPFAIYKRGGFGDWAQWIELFGMPQRVGKYNTYDPESKRQLEQAMERAGSAPWMVIPKEADVEMRESSASNGISFKQFIDACNQEMLVGILGQTLTTISGERGARSLGTVHQEVEEAKNKSDMRYLQRVLNRHLLPFLELQGLPTKGGRFAYPESTEPVTVQELSILNTMMDIPKKWLHERFGIPMEEEQGEATIDEEAPDHSEKSDPPDHSDKSTPTKKGLSSFFVQAPQQVVGLMKDLWKSWTTSTPRHIELEDGTTIDLGNLLSKALREVYGSQGDGLSPSLFEANNLPMQEALSVVLGPSSFGVEEPAFEYELRYNMAVWSAFKTHAEMESLGALLVKPNGRLRSFAEFRKLAEKVIGKYNVQWLRTEYDTAVLKARSAVQYKEALKTKALYPNLEYLQSDSVDKRPEHLAFVGTILPIDHPWWDTHLPPLDWNCKCRVRPTDKAPTALPDGSLKDEPKDGLANNPGKSGSLFDLHKHPYTKGQGLPTCPECRRQGLVKGAKLADDTGKLCPMHQLAKKVEDARREYLSLSSEYKRICFDEQSGGYVAIHKDRIPTATSSGNERRVYEKELNMATTFAKHGFRQQLILEPENTAGVDVICNGIKADYKQLSSHNNILKQAKHAIAKQGANMILFEFTKRNPKIGEKLHQLKQMGIRAYYYYSDDPKTIYEL